MKALLLASGKGTRLLPFTRDVNKHLIQIKGKSMILYVIDNIVSSGLSDIVVVYNKSGKEIPKVVSAYIRKKYKNVNTIFVLEKGEVLGTPNSISAAKGEIGNEAFVVVFGDVIFENSLQKYISDFKKSNLDGKFLFAHVDNPKSHASVFFRNGKLSKIVEKCQKPENDIVVTTYDIFTSKVWNYFQKLEISKRGEYEISDLRNLMIKNHHVGYDFVKGWWIDVGTKERLKLAEKFLGGKNK